MATQPYETHYMYDKVRFTYRQVIDCVDGSNKIKEANLIYLPMPSAMSLVPNAPMNSDGNLTNNSRDYGRQYAPWWHPNPAYRAYLQRARFPDITANTLRGSLGIATKADPEFEIPSSIAYLEEDSDNNGLSIVGLYSKALGENIKLGKVVLAADVDQKKNRFYIKIYSADNNINWSYKFVNGERVYTSCSFFEDECREVVREYYLNEEDENAYVRWWKEGKVFIPDDQEMETVPLIYMGKPFKKLPVSFIGSVENTPEPDLIPLQGISDIAITIYQEDADLRQAHFMTCNPTLFLFGVPKNETPTVVGSTVIVGVSNPQGKAEYPATDTSALEHIRNYTKDLYLEAANYGANFIATPGNRESGEALSIRNSMRGANLVHCVKMTSDGINYLLRMIAEIVGSDANSVVFAGNTEFSEMILTAQDITALVSAWLQGAIDHDTLLNNLRDAGYIDSSSTNDQIKDAIALAPPLGANPEEKEDGNEGQE